jgi:orotate phosphoribosyltransferase
MEKTSYSYDLARKALEMGAIRLSPDKPFCWASGYYMPIYNDNRTFLGDPKARQMIAKAFKEILEKLNYDPDNVAGTSTAGIPHATTLGDLLGKPVSYIRSSSKDHGLQNQIEGLGRNPGYEGKKVVLIEDLISTGMSSIKAVKAIQEANGLVPYCLAIFSYGTDQGKQAFAELDPKCSPLTILDYNYVIPIAKEIGYIHPDQEKMLLEWSASPFTWGEKHGWKKEER